MRYTYKNRTVCIPDKEIDNLVDSLEISIDEAIHLWLSDHSMEENEEQKNLDKEAKKNYVSREPAPSKPRKERKPIEKKVSDEKKELFSNILTFLTENYNENVKILNENKLIEIKIGEKVFKVDIVEQRPPKNTKKA